MGSIDKVKEKLKISNAFQGLHLSEEDLIMAANNEVRRVSKKEF